MNVPLALSIGFAVGIAFARMVDFAFDLRSRSAPGLAVVAPVAWALLCTAYGLALQ